jgi:hypothetical protein
MTAQPTDSYNPDFGASLTFSFKEGLCCQILPNGAIQQTLIENGVNQTKTSLPSDRPTKDLMRIVTRDGSLIRHLPDGNQVIYLPDGTITRTGD